MKKTYIFILMLTVLFIFSSCQNNDTTEVSVTESVEIDEDVEEVEKQRVDGGELTIAITPPKTFNPLKNEDTYIDRMLGLIFQDLYILDENKKPIPNLIETATPNYADNTLSITLKKDLYWHDGMPITADDIIYSIQVLQSASENAIYKKDVNNIISYKKIDDYTVSIQYNDPKYLMGYDLLFPIIPKHYYSQANESNNYDMLPIGNGYFKFDEIIDSKNYTLVRDESKPDKANIEKVNVIVLQDDATELYAFERDNIDFIISDIEEWGEYRVSKKANIYDFTNQTFEFIGFNLDRLLISDKWLREIIAYSINKEEILDRIYLNNGKVTNTFVNPDSWLYTDEVKKYDSGYEEIKNIISKNYIYDKEENILYKEINGLKKEVRFSILVNEENTMRVSVAEYIKNNLINIGIDVEVQAVPFNEYIEKLNMKNFDVVIGGFRFDNDQDPTVFLQDNIFNYNTEELNNRIVAFNNATDEQSYKTALEELQELIATDLPFISLVYSENIILTDENLIIPNLPSYSNVFSNVNEWYWVE